MKRLSFFQKIILALNVLALIALMLSVSAQWINPQRIWIPAFLGLGFPVVALINVSFAIFWLIARKRWWMMSLIVVLASLIFFTKYIAFRPFAANQLDEGYRILSYNVQNFDLYNWSHNTESRDEMIALIKEQDPDIVCFQEFYHEDGDGFVNVERVSRELGLPHHHFANTFSLRGKDHWGIATFSKYPILQAEPVLFEGAKLNGILWTDIQLDSATVRVFNVHLQSIKFNQEDFEHLEDDTKESSRRIAGKLRRGFLKRADQVKLVTAGIEQSPHPVIVCGDFNDTPVSYTYRTISRGLNDAFMKKGFGLGATYAGFLPTLRIDYILLDESFEVLGFRRIKREITDHYPVIASFK